MARLVRGNDGVRSQWPVVIFGLPSKIRTTSTQTTDRRHKLARALPSDPRLTRFDPRLFARVLRATRTTQLFRFADGFTDARTHKGVPAARDKPSTYPSQQKCNLDVDCFAFEVAAR